MEIYLSTHPIARVLGKVYLDFALTKSYMHPDADRLQLDIKTFTLSTHELQVRRSSFDNTFLPQNPSSATRIITLPTLNIYSIKLGGRLEIHPNTQLDQVTSNSTGIPQNGDDAGDDDIETEEEDDDDLGEEDEFDEEEGLGEEDGSIRDNDGDEDKILEADEDGKLTGDRNGSEEEDDLESIEEIEEEEDLDDSDLNDQEPDEEVDDEDDDEDDDEYGSDWDEDDDDNEYDDDEDELKPLNIASRYEVAQFSPTSPLDTIPASRIIWGQTENTPRQIGYDIT